MTKLRHRFFFVFTILDTYVPLIFHAKIQLKAKKISSGSREDDFVNLLFLVKVAILDNQSDPILQL